MKKKLVTTWLGGCSGCHMSLLDMDERLLEVAKLADILKCPIVDGKTFTSADIALVEGAVSSEEHLEEIREIRKRVKKLVAFGDCAVTGNVTALRNEVGSAAVLKHAYSQVPSDDGQGKMPARLVSPLLPKAVPLHEIVKVDYFIPGCPPSADLIFYVLFELLNDSVPVLSEENRLKYG